MIERIDTVLKQIYGEDCRIMDRQGLSGGCINSAHILTLTGGRRVFLKENRADLAPMFAAEAAGLTALAEVAADTEAISVPSPLAWGGGERSYLITEEVRSGRLGSGSVFGRSLAQLHSRGRGNACGFHADNWIGLTPQPNGREESWFTFFAEKRLGCQWKLARDRGYGDEKSDRGMASLLRRLPDLLPDLDGGRPSLLHGDLWGGNWMAGDNGGAWLIDPAVYYGHREADLAMTQLFGGFPPGFQEGYREEWPLESGFSQRRDIYNLYHLLNHLNLFGPSYWGDVRSIIRRYS